MKTEKNLLIAFLLNLSFSVFEFVGGIVTGSVAIASDAVHDLGDAAGIGLSWLLERKSSRPPDETYTYGRARYSVLGGVITTAILLAGSAAVIFRAVGRFVHPAPIRYDGMILFAVVGVCVNLGAACFTRDGGSLNQRAVHLHLLEDVLGWVVVLAGAVVMRFTDFALLDPLMSIGVAAFILVSAVGNLREALDLFLDKVPRGVSVQDLRERVAAVDGVLDVHHIHVRSLDGQSHDATMHIVTAAGPHRIKDAVREALLPCGIVHVTLELEAPGEPCAGQDCRIGRGGQAACHHHGHHLHHHHGHHHHH